MNLKKLITDNMWDNNSTNVSIGFLLFPDIIVYLFY